MKLCLSNCLLKLVKALLLFQWFKIVRMFLHKENEVIGCIARSVDEKNTDLGVKSD